MARLPLSLRLKALLARHPITANRLLGIIGIRRISKIARKTARRTAQQAYRFVPYHRDLFERHGFGIRIMKRLRWRDFLRLPISDKTDSEFVEDRLLLDSRVPSPDGDALLGRSSGTTSGPVTWPTGWDEFILARAFFWRLVRDLGGNKRKTAIVQMLSIDGGDLTGNLTYRAAVSLKEQTRWPFEVFAAGEEPDTAIAILRWLVRQSYEALLIEAFPGTLERLLDRLEHLRNTDRGTTIEWSRFKQIRVLIGGQAPAPSLRERVRRDLHLDTRDLLSDIVIYGSSDTGQVVAQTSLFTAWLERYLALHPALYVRLGIAEEHQTKPILECIPPLGLYMEQDEDGILLLTAWKHRPLIRYRTNDLVWLRPPRVILRILRREARGWRRDLRQHGLRRRNIPKVASIAIVLGRADDVRIVNGANVSPEMLRQALELAGILPGIQHFKHDTADERPNEYLIYLELREQRDDAARAQLAEQWRPGLLDALIHLPSAMDLYAAHRSNPIDLHLLVRSQGTEEFAGDSAVAKLRYVPHPAPRR